MEDDQEKKNNVVPKSNTDFPETFDSWTVITESMSKANETENVSKLVQSENKLNESDPDASSSGIESLNKTELDTPSKMTLENTDEFSDGISIIEEDSDSLGRHTPLNIYTADEYLLNSNSLYPSEIYSKCSLNNSRQTINILDNQSSSSNLKKGISGFFLISVFIALVAFLAKLKYPEWSENTSISERIIDLELQNNMLRAELDLLSKEIKYIKANTNLRARKNYRDKIDCDKIQNLDKKNNIKDQVNEGDKKNHKDKDKDKIKVYNGEDEQIYEIKSNKKNVKRYFKKPNLIIELKEQIDEPKKVHHVGHIHKMTYPDYIKDLLDFADYDINYKKANLFSIDKTTFDRVLNVLKDLGIDPITKENYDQMLENYCSIKRNCYRSEEQEEKIAGWTEKPRSQNIYRPGETELRKQLRALELEELRNIVARRSEDPEYKANAAQILMEKVKQHKFEYKLLYKRKEKVSPEIKPSETKTESKDYDKPKDDVHKTKNENSNELNQAKDKINDKEKACDVSKEKCQKNNDNKGFKDIKQSKVKHESKEKDYDADKKNINKNDSFKENKQFKEKHDLKGKEYDESKKNILKNKNLKENKQSTEKYDSKKKGYNTSKENVYENKKENSKDKGVSRNDWHEKLMNERENIRNAKNDFDRRKKNWYSERGHSREQARVTHD